MKKKYYFAIMLALALCANTVLAQKSLTVYKIPEGTEINIDGENSDFWTTLSGFDEDQKNQIYNTKDGNDNLVEPEDQYDHDVTWNAAYNDTAVFFFFTVVDDEVQEPDSETQSWYHDKIELYFQVGSGELDTENGDISNNCQDGYYQYDFPIVHFDGKVTGLNTTCQDLQTGQSDWRTVITDDGYTMEMYVTFEGLKDENGDAFVPGGDATLKCEPHVHDNDNTDLAESNPRTRAYWSLDGQAGSATGGHAWEHGAWETGKIGSLVFSDTELVGESAIANIAGSHVRIYPNPFHNKLTFDGNLTDIAIFNLIGKKIAETNLNTTKSVNLESLKSGIYFVKLYKNGKQIGALKICKQ